MQLPTLQPSRDQHEQGPNMLPIVWPQWSYLTTNPLPHLSCQKQKFAKKNFGLYSSANTQLEQNSNLQKGSPTHVIIKLKVMKKNKLSLDLQKGHQHMQS